MNIQRNRERRETLGYWPAQDAKNGESVGLVSNLSDEGLQIHSRHAFIKGQTLTLRINVNSEMAGTDHFFLIVENVWCNTSGTPDLHYAGFKIVDLPDRSRRSIQNLLQAFSYPAPEQASSTSARKAE